MGQIISDYCKMLTRKENVVHSEMRVTRYCMSDEIEAFQDSWEVGLTTSGKSD